MDAPQLKNNAFARGIIKTRIIDGACSAVNTQGKAVSETERIQELNHNGGL